MECPKGIAVMVRMVDAATFDHQEIAGHPAVQPLYGEAGHFCQTGLAAGITGAIRLVLHVGGLEQTQDLPWCRVEVIKSLC